MARASIHNFCQVIGTGQISAAWPAFGALQNGLPRPFGYAQGRLFWCLDVVNADLDLGFTIEAGCPISRDVGEKWGFQIDLGHYATRSSCLLEVNSLDT